MPDNYHTKRKYLQSIMDNEEEASQILRDSPPAHVYEFDRWLYLQIIAGRNKIGIKTTFDEKQRWKRFLRHSRLVHWVAKKQ